MGKITEQEYIEEARAEIEEQWLTIRHAIKVGLLRIKYLRGLIKSRKILGRLNRLETTVVHQIEVQEEPSGLQQIKVNFIRT